MGTAFRFGRVLPRRLRGQGRRLAADSVAVIVLVGNRVCLKSPWHWITFNS